MHFLSIPESEQSIISRSVISPTLDPTTGLALKKPLGKKRSSESTGKLSSFYLTLVFEICSGLPPV